MMHQIDSFAQQATKRVLRTLSLFDPRRALRYLRSVSHRLDQIAAVNAEVVALADRGLRTVLECETLLRETFARESLVRQMEGRLADLTSAIDRAEFEQRSRAEQLLAEIARRDDVISSLRLDQWKIREYEGLLRYQRRQDYFRAIDEGRLSVPVLETEHPVALLSNDTQFPRGTKNDNSIVPRFNRKLYQHFHAHDPIRVLDIGCAGGGFVRSLLDDGHFAVGLEGSDYQLVNQGAEWSTIPLHLFTCDVTKPFRLTERATGEPLLFHAITAWEVLEHIPEEALPGLIENLDRHLAPGGLLLFSIATFLDWDHFTGVVWHVTVKPRSWWEERFANLGFEVEENHPFGKDDWLRGSGHCRGDWHEDHGLGFHIAIKRRLASSVAAEPDEGWQASVA